MNIFVLDGNAKYAAKYHCDKHVIKMILESAQILSTVHGRYNSQPINVYKPTHKNHPCVLWAGECAENYEWLWHLFRWLCNEYRQRYSKVHATERKLLHNLESPPLELRSKGFSTKPAMAMPDQYKRPNVVDAYRAYYKGEKANIATWNYSQTPWWW